MLHFFHTLLLIPSLILSATACQSGSGNAESDIANRDSLPSENYVSDEGYNTAWINSEGATVKDRFITPDGYQRKAYKAGEFGYFLQHLPLKKMGSEVLYYNGNVKAQNKIYVSVVNLPIGTRDLHQCADAVMRLRADYLYQQKDLRKFTSTSYLMRSPVITQTILKVTIVQKNTGSIWNTYLHMPTQPHSMMNYLPCPLSVILKSETHLFKREIQ